MLIVIADIIGPEVYGKPAVVGACFYPKYVKEWPARDFPVFIHFGVAICRFRREPEWLRWNPAKAAGRLLNKNISTRLEYTVPIPVSGVDARRLGWHYDVSSHSGVA